MTAVRWVLVALALAVVAAPCLADDHDGTSPIPAGAEGYALTVVQGNRVERIPVRYLGLYPDFVGPGYDVHLVKLEGPVAERVGVASGMSGSPVFFDDKLIGALSYRLGAIPAEPVAGVTPIGDMRAAARADGVPAGGTVSANAIRTPIQIGALSGPVRDWIEPQLVELGFSPVAGGGAGGADVPAELQPGSPVGVELVRGAQVIAATGTVTWVDDEGVLAFGHPFLGVGRVELPMVAAKVIHTLADRAGSIKLAATGQEIGAIVEDRLTAIVGRYDHRAAMIPVRVAFRGPAHGGEPFEFEVVRNSVLAPLFAGAVVANGLLSNTAYESRATILASGALRLRGVGVLPLEIAASGDGASDPAVALGSRIQAVLGALWHNRFAEPVLESLELDVEVVPGHRSYSLVDVNYDRGPVRPGQRLEVECTLRRYRGELVHRTLELEIPQGVAPGTRLALAIGSPDGVDRALGRPLARRLRTAQTLDAVAHVFAGLRSAHRLTGALYRSAPGVYSGGVTYDNLPPTAQRLLGSATTDRAARGRVSTLARAERELDGPIDGAQVLQLQVEPIRKKKPNRSRR
ncbi:MAG: hypothetical protein GY716_05075 [bacterium]|nr:hypothetical protein [bacterium]